MSEVVLAEQDQHDVVLPTEKVPTAAHVNFVSASLHTPINPDLQADRVTCMIILRAFEI
jgi:hypothetical protein